MNKKQFKIGDRVITPVSIRSGEITKITESLCPYGDVRTKHYTVEIELPSMKTRSFYTMTGEFQASTLKRIEDE